MQITLYRGSDEFSAELECDPETGEIGGEYPLDILVQRNPIGTCAYVLNTDAQAAMVDAHIKLMQSKKKALQNNADRARAALKQVMQLTGVLSLKSDDGTFKATLQKERDESIEVFDSLQVPLDYTREIPATYAPDKALIKKAIKDGYEVPGAKIVKNDRLVIA